MSYFNKELKFKKFKVGFLDSWTEFQKLNSGCEENFFSFISFVVGTALKVLSIFSTTHCHTEIN